MQSIITGEIYFNTNSSFNWVKIPGVFRRVSAPLVLGFLPVVCVSNLWIVSLQIKIRCE